MSDRIIKFRAWCGEPSRHMHYFGLEGTTLGKVPIMQFTGLHDKNGKEIYEGDVVDYDGDKGEVRYGKLKTQIEGGKYHITGWFVAIKDSGYEQLWPLENNGGEVVGNIYEGTELQK